MRSLAFGGEEALGVSPLVIPADSSEEVELVPSPCCACEDELGCAASCCWEGGACSTGEAVCFVGGAGSDCVRRLGGQKNADCVDPSFLVDAEPAVPDWSMLTLPSSDNDRSRLGGVFFITGGLPWGDDIPDCGFTKEAERPAPPIGMSIIAIGADAMADCPRENPALPMDEAGTPAAIVLSRWAAP